MSIEAVEIANVETAAQKLAVEIYMARARQEQAKREIESALRSIKNSAERGQEQHDAGYAVSEHRFLESYVRSLTEAVNALQENAVLEQRLRYLVAE